MIVATIFQCNTCINKIFCFAICLSHIITILQTDVLSKKKFFLLPALYILNVDTMLHHFHHVLLELWPLFYGRKPLTCICAACKTHISNAPFIKDLEFVHWQPSIYMYCLPWMCNFGPLEMRFQILKS